MRPRHLLLVAAALALGACGLGNEPAIEAGDREVSHGELADQLELFAAHPEFVQTFFSGADPTVRAGSYDREYVEQIMTLLIGEMLFEQAITDLDLPVDPEVRDQITLELGTPDPNLGNRSLLDLIGSDGEDGSEPAQQLRDRIVDYFVRQQTFQSGFSDEGSFNEYVSEVTDDISVSERYGTFDPQAGNIVSPEGPVPSLEGTDVVG